MRYDVHQQSIFRFREIIAYLLRLCNVWNERRKENVLTHFAHSGVHALVKYQCSSVRRDPLDFHPTVNLVSKKYQ